MKTSDDATGPCADGPGPLTGEPGAEPGRLRIAVVGAGAAGTLAAARLLDRAGSRGLALDVHLIDPAEQNGRGVAYRTRDARHRLNVPAGRMSADPDNPDDFLHWIQARTGRPADPYGFQPRGRYACYLSDVLGHSVDRARGTAELHRLHDRATALRPAAGGELRLALASGTVLRVDAAVAALGGYAPGTDWAPAALRDSPRFVADPWAPGALESVPEQGDVLLVGTGLTMADVALVLGRRGRTLHAVSRNGLLPLAHAPQAADPVPAPDLDHCTDLASIRRAVLAHLSAARRRGDWRPAMDGLRPVTAELWQRLGPADRRRFLERDARVWDAHRHRMSPDTAGALAEACADGRLTVAAGTVVAAEPAGSGLRVTLTGGRVLEVAAVVNCTGPQGVLAQSGDPLALDLLATGHGSPGPLGLGFATTSEGRLVDAHGQAPLALWTLGPTRRGSLWESTAVPELRVQSLDLAAAVLTDLERRTAAGRARRPVRIR